MGFPKNSAFGQEEERQEAFQESLAAKVLPGFPPAEDKDPAVKGAGLSTGDVESVYHTADQALANLEAGNTTVALQLLQEVRDDLYGFLH